MRHGAEPATLDHPLPAAPARQIRALPVEDSTEREARERLIHRLAADRLRELRDDGVTTAYVARMYGVDAEEIERLGADLLHLRSY